MQQRSFATGEAGGGEPPAKGLPADKMCFESIVLFSGQVVFELKETNLYFFFLFLRIRTQGSKRLRLLAKDIYCTP